MGPLTRPNVRGCLFTDWQKTNDPLNIDQINLIKQLGEGDSGSGDKQRRPCLGGTRVDVLEHIKTWVDDDAYDDKRIMWLTAPAGIGKSSVAASIESHLRETSQLGAAFYFVRSNPKRNERAIAEVARQLASRHTSLREEICSKVEADIDIGRKSSAEQYSRLIQEPLENLPSTTPKLVIIFDALDECDEGDITTLLRLISRGIVEMPPGVKFFMTSRRETYLKALIDSAKWKSLVEHRHLEAEDSATVAGDIGRFLEEQLPLVAEKFGIDDSNWPGKEVRDKLVHLSDNLFIWASTAVALVANSRVPETRLEHILTSSSLGNLDSLYDEILEKACPLDTDAADLNLLNEVLGTLAVAREPLNVDTLTALLSHVAGRSLTPGKVRSQVLNYLHAVLLVPDDSAGVIRFLHQSFVDFLISNRCHPRFLVQPTSHHHRMALSCFQRMEDLKQNICNVDPSKLNSEVEDLPDRISTHIQLPLQYSCKHWAAHVFHSAHADNILDVLLGFLTTRVLFWVEALSILGLTAQGVYMAKEVEQWVTVCKSL